MKQRRLHSLFESMTNVFIGYGVAVLSQLIVFPMFEIRLPFTDNLLIGAWFTAISVARSYAVRRWFTRRTE